MDYIKRLQVSAARNMRIRALFAKGMKQAHIARQFGISRERVRQIINRKEPT
jgi:predicted XRE-type DNA-binding protein